MPLKIFKHFQIGFAGAQKVLVMDKFSSCQEAFEDCTFVWVSVIAYELPIPCKVCETQNVACGPLSDTGICREVGQLGVPSVDLVDLSSPNPALQSSPSCHRSGKHTVKQDLLKEKMVKNMRSPPRGKGGATTVKNSVSITSTLSLSSNKAILPVPHSSLHSNQVIDLSSKANAEAQATDLSSTSL
uniref:Uncharacterized protein n=1 Tax=Glossina pallidipes TaxID=7398 RepID=A0A1A9Z9W6_GLOPL